MDDEHESFEDDDETESINPSSPVLFQRLRCSCLSTGCRFGLVTSDGCRFVEVLSYVVDNLENHSTSSHKMN